MSVTTWVETNPPNTEAASLGDDAIRSLKVSIAEGLSTSMYWPGTGGGSAASAGIMKLGAARTFYGTASQVSVGQSGQLMLTSDTSRLYAIPPTGAFVVGSVFGVDAATYPGNGVRWHTASGVTLNGSGTTQGYGVTYNGVPRVTASAWTTVDVGVALTVQPYQSGFSVQAYDKDFAPVAASKVSVLWMSLGTVTV
jgi:hypothetical protein